jgi:DNA repair photolyase
MNADTETEYRIRKSKFVSVFDKAPEGAYCPAFIKLVLANGCPYHCGYCYTEGTFRGAAGPGKPVVFNNPVNDIWKEIVAGNPGLYNAGELADSLAPNSRYPEILSLIYNFANKNPGDKKALLLLTKSTYQENEALLSRVERLNLHASPNIVWAVSITTKESAERWGENSWEGRVELIKHFSDLGYRLRIRLDPITLDADGDYGNMDEIIDIINNTNCELVTAGMLRPYPALYKKNMKKYLEKSFPLELDCSMMRYNPKIRAKMFQMIRGKLNVNIPLALCKESYDVWVDAGLTVTKCCCQI